MNHATASSIRSIELLSEDEEGFLRVLFVQPKSLTAKVRNDLIRIIGKSNDDYLLALSSNFDTIEFVFIDKQKREKVGPGGGPKIFSVDRRKPSPQDVRTLRQFTWSWTHQVLKPVFGHLGFLPLPQPASPGGDDSKPDIFLKDPTGAHNLSAAFVYPWGRWLDGPDFQDPDHPDENPGARVVAAIEEAR